MPTIASLFIIAYYINPTEYAVHDKYRLRFECQNEEALMKINVVENEQIMISLVESDYGWWHEVWDKSLECFSVHGELDRSYPVELLRDRFDSVCPGITDTFIDLYNTYKDQLDL